MLAGYEEEINGFVFKELGDLGKPRFLVVGLPDVGLVGSIATLYLVRSLGMKLAVGVDSYTLLPPIVVIYKGEPHYPIRIYSNGDMAALVTDVPIPPTSIAPLGTAIVEYSRVVGVEYVVSLTGIGNPRRVEMERPGIYVVASDKSVALEARRILGIANDLDNGILVGPYAIILKESSKKRVKNLVLMADSYIDMPDPEASAITLEALAKIAEFKVDVEPLIKEAEIVKLRMKELMKETRSVMARMGKGLEYRSPVMFT